MKIIKPKKLKKGDTIGILAVSGRIKEYEKIENAKTFFEKEGYNIVISSTCKTSHRYMAGNNDEDCLNAFQSFFSDKSIDAILCARGGFGTLKLINKIDWNIVKNNPKIFAGYSDITILLNMIYKNTGLITFHAPMANGDFGSEINEYTKESFFRTLNGNASCFNAKNIEVFKKGKAKGILWGGNLASLVSLCGLDFIPDKNLILFLEDLNEPSYKIDRMLTQLFNIEKIKKNVKGIVLGEFQNLSNTDEFSEIFNEFANRLNIPICGGFKITHGKVKDTLPLGIDVYFNSENGSIIIQKYYNN